jgi:glycosyltransferase involved in cell wall biosynthesis
MSAPRVLLSFPMRIGVPGIGMTAWYQATGLARQGARVSVVCGSVERPLPGVRVLLETMKAGSLKIPYRCFGSHRAAAFHDRRAARVLARRAGDFDVLHAWPGGCERTFAAARAGGVPSFLERPNAHTGFAFEAVARECERLGIVLDASSPHAFDARKLSREEREFAAADALLCPSDFVAATHARAGEPERRLLRHRYGYDPERFAAPAPGGERRTPVISFVGRLEPRKGVHLLLEAWRRAGVGDRAGLVLCGRMEPGYDAVLAPLLDQPGVELRGHVDDPGAVLRESDALALPSLEEGSALVTYEARGCGATLIVSDRAGAHVRNGHDGLVHAAGDVDALARHVRRLVDEPRLRASLRAKSLAGAGDLTWDAAASALLRAYAQGAARDTAARRRKRGLSPHVRWACT